MKFLFVHQNFPGQFKHLAPALVARGHEVTALIMRDIKAPEWQGVRLVRYSPKRGTSREIHPWVSDFETKTIRGEAAFRKALEMRDSGYRPDAIIAHHGWGESLFVKEVWPEAALGIYCEFYYHPQGADTGFDPEFPTNDPGDACRLRLKNFNNLLHFETADAGISPTEWQASTFPPRFRERITVVHDGIDTNVVAPNPIVQMTITDQNGGKIALDRGSEVITFVNRNLEPYRGYHIFMRALPEILARRPKARILIVGGDGVSYGARPDPDTYGEKSWREVFIEEVRTRIPDEDWARVHFLGNIRYEHFIPLLQLSTVHVYLTYPFVLSWSLLEAMSAGCSIVASDTQPLQEAIRHDLTGRLFDLFDPKALASEVCLLADDPERRQKLGEQARAFAISNYDLQSVCLPRQLAWAEGLASRSMGAGHGA
ncbi:glycosyltransferase [Spiribacter aquaticus]|uniref:Glycosyltransferase n=1 Tax=Spiribacter aquaticus TaxID=1935996 RepID=A0A557RGN2_9GAMM|nr:MULTISPECIES: glycosyltransferase [Spiribacter]KAF0280941.1 glycosyl transferase [Spiribacter roseus]TVO64301.1 glycosyltransferase [Spiribacter aquaticus]